MKANKQAKAKAQFRWRKLGGYAWRSAANLLPGIGLEISGVAADLAGPYIVGLIINRQSLEAAAQGASFYLRLLALYFGAVCAAAGLRYAAGIFLQRGANNIARLIQLDVFAHLQKLPISFFDQLPAGKVVSRVTNDTKAVRVLFASVLVRLLTAAVYGLGIYFNLILLDYRLFILALLPLPVLVFTFSDFRRKSARWNHIYRRAISELNGKLNENIQGIEVIQSLACEEIVTAEFEEVNQQHYETGLKLTKLWSYSTYNIVQVLQYLMLGVVLAYFGYGNLSARWLVPLGSLYIFIDYMTKFFDQTNQAMQRVGDLERATGAADHIFELLQEETICESDAPLPELKGELSFEQVSFAYSQEDVLKQLSFTVKAGETAAFVGQTGSGKTTIMNLLLGFYRPGSGRILVDGLSYEDIPIQSLRQQMAIVLQDPYLFTGTLYSNIALNRSHISPEAAERALRDVGGSMLLERLEQGIHSPVSEKGSTFSTGERQLISFARALAQNPRILVLDEATSSVDSETEGLIQRGIAHLEQGRTTLIIAHRLSTIKNANIIYVLRAGLIVEAGTHSELLKLEGVYAQMVEEQANTAAGR